MTGSMRIYWSFASQWWSL